MSQTLSPSRLPVDDSATTSVKQAYVVSLSCFGLKELAALRGSSEAEFVMRRCMRRFERTLEVAGGELLPSSGRGTSALFSSGEAALQAGRNAILAVSNLPPISRVLVGGRGALTRGTVIRFGDDVLGHPIDEADILAGMASASCLVVQAKASAKLLSSLATHCCVELPSGDRSIRCVPGAGGMGGQSDIPTHNRLVLLYQDRTLYVRNRRQHLLIGRDTTCDLVVDHASVSRTHARIEWRDTGFILIDHSVNGTFVARNGEPEQIVQQSAVVLGKNSGVISLGHPGCKSFHTPIDFELHTL